MADSKQLILAIVLSALVILVWQILVGIPQTEQQRQVSEEIRQEEISRTPAVTGDGLTPSVTDPEAPGIPGATTPSDDRALATAPRVDIDTPSVVGSLNLEGAKIDDLRLRHYRRTVDPDSPIVTLLSPAGSVDPFAASHGWAAAPDVNVRLPDGNSVWTAPAGARLTPSTPVTLTWDNGEGLIFKRTFSIDDDYMFTVRQEVENTTGEAIVLFPYALVSRTGTPPTLGFFILHEGLIGVLGDDGLVEVKYSSLNDGPTTISHTSTGGWLGITDKYWAATVIPDPNSEIEARFVGAQRGGRNVYQADYLVRDAVTIPGNGTGSYESRVFAGAKVASIVDAYGEMYDITRFELLIDWGWFYFITKPLFNLLMFFHNIVGNFGVAILIVTVLIKIVFFPLANKSYKSMSAMKKLQPELLKIRERFPDDRMKQQEAMMALYKKEKVTPVSGCLPILVQIPVFFALYKVLFVSIEMRHAPFFGWVQDLSAQDPTTIFNLFGLIPWQPPSFLMLGIWPILMGLTMWVQMRLNPAPPDPIQAKIFNWMPVVFTFILATFPAGLVIYWTWNNFLSILQQYYIMRRQGVEVDLIKNIKDAISPSKPSDKEPDKSETKTS